MHNNGFFREYLEPNYEELKPSKGEDKQATCMNLEPNYEELKLVEEKKEWHHYDHLEPNYEELKRRERRNNNN